MCQLSFISLGDRKLNSLALLTQSATNTETIHQDGFGYFTKSDGWWKTDISPHIMINNGYLIRRNIKSSDPIIAHVRHATATGGVKEINIANSHPFEREHIVLAHNGTLEFKEKGKMNLPEYKGMIDSEIFTDYLNSKIDVNKPFPETLAEVMEEWQGKFAFLIFYKPTESYYAVRGRTAKLHVFEFCPGGNYSGLIVNTELDSLKKGMIRFVNQCQLRGMNITWSQDSFSELPEESIFQYNPEDRRLVKLPISIRENEMPVRTYQTNFLAGKYWETKTNTGSIITGDNNSKDDKEKNMANEILYFMNAYDLSIESMDELCAHVTGIPLLGCNEKQIQSFIYFLEDLDWYVRKFKDKDIVDKWKAWKYSGVTSELDMYKKYNLQFPYFLHSNTSEIRAAMNADRDERNTIYENLSF
jgi:predicted glutamine amidotransferase